jgi:hypothetical protein
MLSEQQDVDPGPLLQPDKIVQDARMIFLATNQAILLWPKPLDVVHCGTQAPRQDMPDSGPPWVKSHPCHTSMGIP